MGDGRMTDRFTFDSASLSIGDEGIGKIQDVGLSWNTEVARHEQERIERAIRGAIMAGYDGVDINYPETFDMHTFGIKSIVPWDAPEPEAANGYRTERYTWHWFSDDELADLLRADAAGDVMDALD